MTPEALRNVLEAALLAAGRALGLDDFLALFEGSRDAPDRAALRSALADLEQSLDGRALELVQVASGYRLQVRKEYSPWLAGLFAERPPRYSRALLETLALIAYRQPITRGEIEDVRGVAVSSNIIKTLMEREWIRVLGHKEVPGRPALFGTTRLFLDHFGLKSLDGLPTLAEIRDLDQVAPDLFAGAPAADASLESALGQEPHLRDASAAPGQVDPDAASQQTSQEILEATPAATPDGTLDQTPAGTPIESLDLGAPAGDDDAVSAGRPAGEGRAAHAGGDVPPPPAAQPDAGAATPGAGDVGADADTAAGAASDEPPARDTAGG